MSRTVEEWIGKTDDTAVPPRVKLRVFEKYGGVCYLSGRKITAGDRWEVEHIVALCNGGEHRESNMAPALSAPHKIKSAADMALKSKNYKTRAKHIGVKKRRSITSWRKFNGDIVRAGKER